MNQASSSDHTPSPDKPADGRGKFVLLAVPVGVIAVLAVIVAIAVSLVR